MSSLLNETAVLAALRQVNDPELGCNIVDLGLVYGVRIEGRRVVVKLTLTSPGCPMAGSLVSAARSVLLALDGVEDAEVELAWEPRWSPARMTDRGRKLTGVD
jgi:metal-sulfur cluster biosynthetic enzyme